MCMLIDISQVSIYLLRYKNLKIVIIIIIMFFDLRKKEKCQQEKPKKIMIICCQFQLFENAYSCCIDMAQK